MILLTVFGNSLSAHAATLTWWATGSTGAVGGAGTWNTTDLRWTADGSSWSAWSNTQIDTAVFGGASSGTVTLSAGITANGLTFDIAGYAISGNTLTLAGGTAAVAVNANTATINSIVTGTAALRKLGTGTLSLSGNNTYSGGTVVDSGVLALGGADNGSSRVGSGTLTINAGASVLSTADNVLANGSSAVTPSVAVNGGVWDSQTFVAGFRAMALNSGTLSRSSSYWYSNSASQINSTGASSIAGGTMMLRNVVPFQVDSGTLTVSSVLATDQGAGQLRKTGAGTLSLSGNNTYSGGTVVDAGVLTLGGVDNGSSRVGSGTLTINAGATVLSTAGNSLGWGVAGVTPSIAVNGGVWDAQTFAATFRLATLSSGTLSRSSNYWYSNSASQINSTGASLITGGTMMLRHVVPIQVDSGTLTVSSVLANDQGAVGFNKAGNGVLALTAANSYTGTTIISAGTLRLGSGATSGGISASSPVSISAGASLVFNRSDNYGGSFTNTISGSGGVTLLSGSLTFSNAKTYSGGTVVDAGVLTLGGVDNGSSRVGSGTLTINAGATVLSTADNVFGYGTTDATPSIAVNGGVWDAQTFAATFRLATLSSGTLSRSSSYWYSNSASQINSTGASSITGGTMMLRNVVPFQVDSGTLTVSSVLATDQGAGQLRKTGAGTLSLSGNNTYSGGTVVDAGVLTLGGTDNGFSKVGSGTLTINAGATVLSTAGNVFGYGTTVATPSIAVNGGVWDAQTFAATFRLATLSSGTLSRSSNYWYSNSASQINSTGASSITGGTMMLRNVVPFQVDSGTLTVSSVLATDQGAGQLRKTGAGTLSLSGNNTYSGGTVVDAGVLTLGGTDNGFSKVGSGTLTINAGATVLSTAGNVFGHGTTVATPSIAVNGGVWDAQTFAATFRLATLSSGTLSRSSNYWYSNSASQINSTGASLITGGTMMLRHVVPIQVDSGTLTVSSMLANDQGAVGFNKTGNGVLALTAANSYTGTTTISGGTLSVGSGGVSGALAGNVLNNAALVFNRSDATTFANAISGSGLVRLLSGSLTLSGSNAYSGGTWIDGGKLLVNGSLASGVAAAAGTVLGGSGTIGGTLSGAGLVSPGNSPGILTAAAFDPTSELDAAFEFTALTPNYGVSGTGALNDVLRLTNGSPFISALTDANAVDVYFNVDSIANGDVFEGGFFTGLSAAALLENVENATFRYWIKDNGGSTVFGDANYSSLTSLAGITGVTVNTVSRTTDFGSGSVTGSVTQFVIVPEPGSLALAGIGASVGGWLLWKRRRIPQITKM